MTAGHPDPIVLQTVVARVHRYLGEDTPGRLLSASGHGSATILRMVFNGRERTLVAKPYPAGGPIATASLFSAVHEQLRSADSHWASVVPRIVAVQDPANFTVRDYVPGEPLLQVLQRALLFPRRTDPEPYIRMVAHSLSVLHGHRASDHGIKSARTLNVHYLRSIGRLLHSTGLAGHADLVPLVERLLPASFLDQAGDRVLLVDSQPKNVIITPDSKIKFIDIDYIEGHPALSVSEFLAALDRMSLRAPWPSAVRRLEAWKRLLVETYCASPSGHFASGLPLFYPSSLLQHLEWHCEGRPASRLYLKHAYGKMLERCIDALWKLGTADSTDTATPLSERAACCPVEKPS